MKQGVADKNVCGRVLIIDIDNHRYQWKHSPENSKIIARGKKCVCYRGFHNHGYVNVIVWRIGLLWEGSRTWMVRFSVVPYDTGVGMWSNDIVSFYMKESVVYNMRRHDTHTISLYCHNNVEWGTHIQLRCYRDKWHYNDVIMDTIASQITSLTTVSSTVYSDADQRKHQSSASLAFVWGIHRGPVNSPHKGPVTQKMFPFDDVITMNIIIWTTPTCYSIL